ncbi:MAG TPA: Wzt carbohydrate-binding domain-containing protein, partial [Roseiflexaceae bacterium]|nr:Wzt carbohydrate-binding domain-containing protein [Roseiflexaceae bacterium]
GPIFGIGLHHEGGMLLSGPNTRFHGYEITRISGQGYVDYQIPELPLLGGRYQISAAIYDKSMLHPYDHHDRLYRLTVQSDSVRERFGILASGGEWVWHEDKQ